MSLVEWFLADARLDVAIVPNTDDAPAPCRCRPTVEVVYRPYDGGGEWIIEIGRRAPHGRWCSYPAWREN